MPPQDSKDKVDPSSQRLARGADPRSERKRIRYAAANIDPGEDDHDDSSGSDSLLHKKPNAGGTVSLVAKKKPLCQDTLLEFEQRCKAEGVYGKQGRVRIHEENCLIILAIKFCLHFMLQQQEEGEQPLHWTVVERMVADHFHIRLGHVTDLRKGILDDGRIGRAREGKKRGAGSPKYPIRCSLHREALGALCNYMTSCHQDGTPLTNRSLRKWLKEKFDKTLSRTTMQRNITKCGFYHCPEKKTYVPVQSAAPNEKKIQEEREEAKDDAPHAHCTYSAQTLREGNHSGASAWTCSGSMPFPLIPTVARAAANQPREEYEADLENEEAQGKQQSRAFNEGEKGVQRDDDDRGDVPLNPLLLPARAAADQCPRVARPAAVAALLRQTSSNDVVGPLSNLDDFDPEQLEPRPMAEAMFQRLQVQQPDAQVDCPLRFPTRDTLVAMNYTYESEEEQLSHYQTSLQEVGPQPYPDTHPPTQHLDSSPQC